MILNNSIFVSILVIIRSNEYCFRNLISNKVTYYCVIKVGVSYCSSIWGGWNLNPG